ALQCLRIDRLVKTRVSSTSQLLLITYPLIWFFSWRNYRRQLRAHPEQRTALTEIFQLNTSTEVLLSKHLIVEWVKG
ncbi:MAG: hypothetical protein ACK5XL_06715, partial [Cyclobacteriaceae bacterium]